MAKEEVILDLQVNQGDAISELEKTKASIIGLKKEQAELTKAYKAGNITLEEYASDSVRLEGILKKQQTTYNTVQKSVTGVKTQMDKLIDSNKELVKTNEKISSSFKDAADKINVAGVSVGDIGTKVSSFINPATAAAGAVTVLAGLYAKSAVGAEDFARAQGTLNALVDQFANRVGNGSGGGWAETFADFVADISIAFTSNTKELAKQRGIEIEIAKFQLEKLRASEETAFLAARIRKDTEKQAEDQRRIRDDEKRTDEQRLAAAKEVEIQLKKNEDARVGVLKDQLRALYLYGEAVGSIEKGGRQQVLTEGEVNFELIKDRDLRIQIRKIQAEQADIQEEINGKLTENISAVRGINKAESEGLEKLRKEAESQAEERRKTARAEVNRRGAGGASISDLASPSRTNFEQLAKKPIELAKKTDQQIIEDKMNANKILEQLDQERLDATQTYLQSALTLAETFGGQGSAAYKALAISQATIDTYRGATAALAPPPVGAGPLLGPALAALTIATGLANVAKITGIAAAGGADFTTSGPTMLLVGDNPGGRERVTVEPLSGRGKTKVFNGGVAMAGGGSLTVDGGAAKNQATTEINGSIMLMNAIKNMPAPVIGVKEFQRVSNRLIAKENVSKLRGR